MTVLTLQAQPTPDEVFSFFDDDNSGYIDPQELRTMFVALRHPISDDELNDAMAQVTAHP